MTDILLLTVLKILFQEVRNAVSICHLGADPSILERGACGKIHTGEKPHKCKECRKFLSI